MNKFLIVVLLTLSLLACGGDEKDISANGVALSSLQITPSEAQIPANFEQQFQVQAVWADGSIQDITQHPDVVWSSSDSSVVTINETGLAKGIGPGAALITVTGTFNNKNQSTTAKVEVTDAYITELQVTPANASVPMGLSQVFMAIATFSDGMKRNVTNTQAVNWRSGDETLARVSNEADRKGMATGVAVGTVAIEAISIDNHGELKASAPLSVTDAVITGMDMTAPADSLPIGLTAQLRALVSLSDGATVDVTEHSSLLWSSNAPEMVSISSSGLVTGLTSGTVVIRASGNLNGVSVTASKQITVNQAAVTRLEIRPEDVVIPAGLQTQFTAMAYLSDGTSLDVTQNRAINWYSDHAEIAAVSPLAGSQGLVIGQAVGTALITAKGILNGISFMASAPLDVSSPVVVDLSLTPLNPSVPVGDKIKLQLKASFSNGSIQDVTEDVTVHWISDTPGVAAISDVIENRGEARGLAEGTTFITANLAGVSTVSLPLTVTPALPIVSDTPGTLCGGEPQPEIKNFPLVCALDLGITANTNTDVSTLIQQSLPSGAGIYFPAGRYVISNDIKISSKNSLVGSTSGVTIFHDPATDKTTSIGDVNYNPIVRDLIIKGIIFDNVSILFYGNKININVSHNAFLNTVNSGAQLAASHHPFNIDGNVFLRDEAHPGLAISTYRNRNTTIQNNVIGDITDDRQITTLNYYNIDTYNLVMKLKRAAASGKINIKEDQGSYISAWYGTDGLTNSHFNKNVIIGSTKSCLKQDSATNACSMWRDHAVYIKQYNNVEVTNNYMKGWPRDASGQAKFRNATGLYFAGNYLEKVSFDARPYSSSHILSMDNTFVFNNRFIESQVTFYQDKPNGSDLFISAKNFVVFDNVFEGKSPPEIWTSWKNPQGEFLESNNLYADFTPVVVDKMFKNIDIDSAKSRLPAEKSSLLTLRPIPLWKEIGHIEGGDLPQDKMARLDIQIDENPNQFVTYSPEHSHHHASERWIDGLINNFNNMIKGACAGGLVDSVLPVNENYKCKFMGPLDDGNKNMIYTTEGKTATYEISIIDKYKNVGSINATEDLKAGQSVKVTVHFESGKTFEALYSPESQYWLKASRWAKRLASKINNGIPGLCAGEYSRTQAASRSGGDKCSQITPVISSNSNLIYTTNGESVDIKLLVLSH